LHSKGITDHDIMEKYTPFGHSDYQHRRREKKFSASKRTGGYLDHQRDSNVPFYKELGNQGIKAEDFR